ncbi:hypothetical protein [Clostridium intestinale]|uniref:hypothetical protein n=1 Tax=Clostridium intestinale TaxID=36845 RepID=UPI002DD6B7DB|nr:hypothetical protein [Clostridium intestinale]WRY53191.1 hypothetical protein P8F83_08290 [Clostridium intestinale]
MRKSNKVKDSDSFKTVYKEKIHDEKGTYISEVQEFNKPEDYDKAFKQYYPNDKEV